MRLTILNHFVFMDFHYKTEERYWKIFSNKYVCVGYGQNGITVTISYFLNVLYLFCVKTCHVDGNMHGNDMQIRLCIVKLGIVSSTYGDFCESSGWRCTCAQSSPNWDL